MRFGSCRIAVHTEIGLEIVTDSRGIELVDFESGSLRDAGWLVVPSNE